MRPSRSPGSINRVSLTAGHRKHKALEFDATTGTSATPYDYGNPVYGSLLAWTADEIVIWHEDPSVGEANLHFPTVGFDLVPVAKEVACRDISKCAPLMGPCDAPERAISFIP